MPDISGLDPVAQVVESLFIQARNLFEELKFDEANTLSKMILLEPRMGRLHRAGLHFILAHSPDDYLWHADEAVGMYENTYTADMPPPTLEQAKDIEELLDNAKSVQARARIDKKALEAKKPTKEEERLWIEQQIAASIEQWEKVLHDDDGDEPQIEEEGPEVKEEPVVKEEVVE